ncbi:MAG: hypothetical protein ACXACY_21830 [Candidatus Hodarchaeales archaeon]|jgi:uncharacterized membrane protein
MTNTIPWIILGVLGLLLVFLAVYITRKEKKEPDYQNFFNIGVAWILIGGAYELLELSRGESFEFNTLLMLGSIFLFTGLLNKGKWNRQMSPY